MFCRLVGKRRRDGLNDVVGFCLALVGPFYGIALPFVLTAAWDNQEGIRELIDQEAQAFASIAFLGRGLPHLDCDLVVEQTRRYARTMVDDEWPRLSRGALSTSLDDETAQLDVSILRYHPNDVAGRARDDQLLASFQRLQTLRGERRFKSEYRVPGAIWAILIFGALSTLGLCFLLDVKSKPLHLFQTALVAIFVVMTLLVTWDLQDPFRGFSTPSPEPFRRLSGNRFMNEASWHALQTSTV